MSLVNTSSFSDVETKDTKTMMPMCILLVMVFFIHFFSGLDTHSVNDFVKVKKQHRLLLLLLVL